MRRLFFVPQLPVDGRYTKWWITKFVEEFKTRFDEVIVLGEDLINKLEDNRQDFKEFTNIENSTVLELAQIEDYLDINPSCNDVLFFADLSFPGIFANVLYTKPFIGKTFAFCHATSKNKYDIFSDIRKSKFKTETAHAMLFDKIFVGSYYHKDKLGWPNIEVVRLPKPPPSIISKHHVEKIYNIISTARPTPQKVNLKLEKRIGNQVGSKIIRKEFTDPEEYSLFLSKAKTMLITSNEETFGYTVMDSIICGTVPIAPRGLCFREILPDEYLFDDHIEASQIIRKVLLGNLDVPVMKCDDEVNNFFNNICNIMKS